MHRVSATDGGAAKRTFRQFYRVVTAATRNHFRKIKPAAPELTIPLFFIIAILGWAPETAGQLKQKTDAVHYVNPGSVATPARSFLFAFGDRIQRPGKERITLTGKYTDRDGTADVSLVWEVPGRFRFDRSDRPGRPIIYNDTNGWNAAAAAIALREADALESLLDDRPESFFYQIVQGGAHRFLGNRFRSDDGKTLNYKGPWYDVYEIFAAVRSPLGNSRRRKLYFFDSQTGLLSRVEYVKTGSVRVSTEMSGWQTLNGQSIPANVVRKENGAIVLTINFTAASIGPSAADGVFPAH